MRTLSMQQIRETLRRYTYDAQAAAPHKRAHDQPEIPPANLVGMERFKSGLRRIPILAPAIVAAYRLIKMPSRIALLLLRLENVFELVTTLSRQHKFASSRLQTLEDMVAEAVIDIQALRSRSDRTDARQEEIWKALSDSLEPMVAEEVRDIQALRSRSDRTDARQEDIWKALSDSLEPMVAEEVRDIQALRSRSDRMDVRQEEIWKALSDSSRTLVALHEQGQHSAQKLSTQIEALKPVIHAGENLIISQVDGFIMAFPAEEWRLATYAILIGQPEPGLYSVMKATIGEGMVVIDVGANVGTYTLLALREIGSRGMVVSYEPTPRAFDILKNNVQVNAFLESGRIDLRRKAVSDGTRTKDTFFVSKKCIGHSSLYADDKLSSNEVEAIEIETVSLDDDIGKRGRVDVVKIDAEGAEPAILRGMRQIINNNPGITIIIEFAPQHLARANVNPHSYLTEIRDQGFEILEVKEPTGELVTATDEALCNCFSVNLMLRKSKAS